MTRAMPGRATCVMLKIDNAAEFAAGLDAWYAALYDAVEGAFRGLTVRAFKEIVWGSPQYTGNLTASWKISIGAPDSSYTETSFKTAHLPKAPREKDGRLYAVLHQRRDPEAIDYALSANGLTVWLVRLGEDVFIQNNTPYAHMADDALGSAPPWLRIVNHPLETIHAADEKLSSEYARMSVRQMLTLGGMHL